MTPRHASRKALVAALAAVAFAAMPMLAPAQTAPAAASAEANGSASRLVLDNTRRILKTIEARRAEFTADRAALRGFIIREFDALFDRDYSARQVLGRHARGADEADIRLFGDALAENILQRYGSSLLDLNTQLQVRIKSETPLRATSACACPASWSAPAPSRSRWTTCCAGPATTGACST